jgi:hypothetical protein
MRLAVPRTVQFCNCCTFFTHSTSTVQNSTRGGMRVGWDMCDREEAKAKAERKTNIPGTAALLIHSLSRLSGDLPRDLGVRVRARMSGRRNVCQILQTSQCSTVWYCTGLPRVGAREAPTPRDFGKESRNEAPHLAPPNRFSFDRRAWPFWSEREGPTHPTHPDSSFPCKASGCDSG